MCAQMLCRVISNVEATISLQWLLQGEIKMDLTLVFEEYVA